ncbi:MAG: hypothetical protein AABX03_01925 [Nanoarchaeota archaeon]
MNNLDIELGKEIDRELIRSLQGNAVQFNLKHEPISLKEFEGIPFMAILGRMGYNKVEMFYMSRNEGADLNDYWNLSNLTRYSNCVVDLDNIQQIGAMGITSSAYLQYITGMPDTESVIKEKLK